MGESYLLNFGNESLQAPGRRHNAHLHQSELQRSEFMSVSMARVCLLSLFVVVRLQGLSWRPKPFNFLDLLQLEPKLEKMSACKAALISQRFWSQRP